MRNCVWVLLCAAIALTPRARAPADDAAEQPPAVAQPSGVEPPSAGAQPAAAAEPAGDNRVASLIRRLGSDAYGERQTAGEELARIGAASRRQLEVAATSSDPEIALHAAELLERLKILELWSPAPVHSVVQGKPASQALSELMEQTGNRILVGDQYGAFHDSPVDLTFDSANFWEVLDDLCRKTGNQVRHHYDIRNPGLVVVAGEPGKFPVAYSGPVRAQVTSARRVFIEELNYEDSASDITHTFQLNLQVMWEDRFRLIAYRSQPELVQAVTDTQEALPATQPSSSGWNVANSGTRQLAMNLRLHPPAATAHKLDLLHLKWGLIAVGDMAAIEVSDLSSAAPHFQDDVELIVESVQERPGGRCEMTLVVNRDRIVPQPQEVMFQESECELFDAEGRAFRKQGQTNSLTDQGAKLRLTFAGESAESHPKTLRFTYPRVRDQRDLEIIFHDVPLPIARPE